MYAEGTSSKGVFVIVSLIICERDANRCVLLSHMSEANICTGAQSRQHRQVVRFRSDDDAAALEAARCRRHRVASRRGPCRSATHAAQCPEAFYAEQAHAAPAARTIADAPWRGGDTAARHDVDMRAGNEAGQRGCAPARGSQRQQVHPPTGADAFAIQTSQNSLSDFP